MSDNLNIQKRNTVLYSNEIKKKEILKKDETQTFSQAVMDSLKEAETSVKEEVKISAHAKKRILGRDINMDAGTMNALNQVLEIAKDKGARNTLAMLGNQAYILSVRDRTLVTVMNGEEMSKHFFTNIDSVYIKEE